MEELRVPTIIEIDTNDIYIKMRECLESSEYDDLSNERDRVNLALEFFKKYLIEKLSSYPELEIDESSGLLDIVEVISKHLPHDYDQSKIDPIIFYLIFIISEYRGWYITWEQNGNPKDNENYIEIKNGKLDKLITGETYDYYKTFGILYSYLIDDTGEIPNIKKLEIK